MTLEVNNSGGGASAELIQLRGTGNLISANFKPDSGVQLYGRTGSNSAAVRLETNSTGVDVTGDLTITDTATDSSAGPELLLYRNSSSPDDGDYLGQIKFQGESDTGATRNYAKITGKISDASNGTEDGILEFAFLKAGSQNINARWTSTELMLLNGTHLSLQDSQEIRVGASDDLKIYHDGSNSYVSDTSTGNLKLVSNGTAVQIEKSDGENMAIFRTDGSVDLYYDNSVKLQTKSDGVDITGELQSDTLDVDGSANIQGSLTVQSDILMGDDDLLKLGDSDDLQISHNGSVSIIDGRFHPIEIRHQSEVHAKFNDDGAVELYYNNSKKFETTSNGVKITGGLQDGDGDLGTSGQVLSSTGTALNWVDADSDPQGVQGLKGNNGSSGSNGAQGIAGSDGTNGSNGSNGSNGAQGTQGSTGATGSVSVSNNANNRVITATGGATANAEANLTFDGTNLTCAGNVTANSDERLKKNITTIDNALDKVTNLRGVEFDYIASGDHNIGIIAQELEGVLPELVHSGEDDIKSVAYGNLTAVLIEAVKELKKENDALSARIKSLEDR